MRIVFRLVLPAGLLAATACSRSPAQTEVFANPYAAVDEGAIRARIDGDDVVVRLPLSRRTTRILAGSVEARLIDLSQDNEPVAASATRSLVQASELASHTLRLRGAAQGLSRAQAASRVIAWRVEVMGGALYGNKSLYAALGRLEVEVRGPTEIPQGGAAPLRVIVRDADSLAPVAGAHVSVALERDGEPALALAEGVTDGLGEHVTSVGLPAGVMEGNVEVSVEHDGAQVWTASLLRVVEDRKIHLSTDKTIYKPGQTIALRALALAGTTQEPLAAREVTFEALDGKGNKVFKRRVVSDAFGVAASEVPTDVRVNEGMWTLSASIDSTKTTLKLLVARYNLPKMKLSLTADREFAEPGNHLTCTLDARYLFGEPVAGASVSVEARLKSGATLATLHGVTQSEGVVSFGFDIPAMGSLADGELLLVGAALVDSAGQGEQAELALPLVAAPVVIAALPEAGAPVIGIENVVYLVVSDPVGRPLVAHVEIVGDVVASLTSDASGVAELRFTPARAAVSLVVTAVDGAGRLGRRTFSLDDQGSDVMLVRTDKAVYQVGETATVRVITAPRDARVYLDLYRGAQSLDARALSLTQGVAETTIAITEAMRGLVAVDALVLAEAGEVLRGTQRLLVDPDDRLQVLVEPLAAEYLPGAEAALRVRVRDAAGQPAVASVGLSVVNEASFALGGEPVGDVRTFVHLDPRLLPADLRVLSRSAADLFTLAPGAEREALARLLFAAGKDLPRPGLEYNSIREELPLVRSALEAVVERHAQTFLEDLAPLVQAGIISYANIHEQVQARSRNLIDPFGRTYTSKVDDPTWGQLTLGSGGPDERRGNADDVSATVYYEWILWGGDRVGAGDCPDCDFAAVPEAGAPPPDPTASAAAPAPGVKVRSDFRETVYKNPTLITDAAGEAVVSFPLAHAITTWRATALGSDARGRLGATRAQFRTFQPFFVDFDLPTRLTRGDEIELRAVVYNYLPATADVTVSLDSAPWLSILSSGSQALSLAPSEVRAVTFRIRALMAGAHSLTLRGLGGGVDDALVREAQVAPDGVPEVVTFSDKLADTREHVITIPADTLSGSTSVVLTLTPGFVAEAVQGTESMLEEPNGCFEQTTSSTWPNTLVTDYLRDTGQLTAELEERAFGMVTRGYQRLLTFESPTGGFNWWGDSDPGNRILSAIMLWQLKDLESLIEIDPAVRDRTLSWLVAQQRADGSWDAGDALHAGNEVLGTSVARTTAFIAWALAHTGWADAATTRAADYLRSNSPPDSDLYATALAANALAKIDPNGAATTTLLARLDHLKDARADGQIVWPSETPSWTGAGGEVAALETTGLVAYGLMSAQAYPGNTAGAMRFIIAHKDSVGTWYNTQATVNALRALAAAASPTGSDAEGAFTVAVNGQVAATLALTAADGDVYQTIDLTPFVRVGDNTVAVDLAGTGELSYQLTRTVHRLGLGPDAGLFGLEVQYDRTEVQVGDSVQVTAVAENHDLGIRDQVMVRLGLAPGLVPWEDDLKALVGAGLVARYEIKPDNITFYLMGLMPSEVRPLALRLRATLAMQAAAPMSAIYPYYEPTLRTVAAAQPLVVLP